MELRQTNLTRRTNQQRSRPWMGFLLVGLVHAACAASAMEIASTNPPSRQMLLRDSMGQLTIIPTNRISRHLLPPGDQKQACASSHRTMRRRAGPSGKTSLTRAIGKRPKDVFHCGTSSIPVTWFDTSAISGCACIRTDSPSCVCASSIASSLRGASSSRGIARCTSRSRAKRSECVWR